MSNNSLLNLPEWYRFCAKYRYDLFGFAVDVVGLKPTWQQKILFDSIVFDGSRVSVASGHGCFGRGTLVRLFNGKTKAVEHLKIGDQLRGDDNTARDIVGTIKGREELFKLTLSNGLERVFNKSHTMHLTAIKTSVGWRKGETVTVPLYKWLKWSDEQKSVFGIERIRNKNYKKRQVIQIVKSESIGEGDYFGFTLFDNPLFVDANGLILHNTGKTASAGVTALWHLLCFPKSTMLFTAPQIGVLKSQVWKEIDLSLSRMKQGRFAWLAREVVNLAESVYVRGHHASWYVKAKTAPRHQSTNIAGFHGTHYMLWVDEACGVPDSVCEVVTGALTGDSNRAVLTSQPASNVGFFYDTHHRLSTRYGGQWIALTFSGEDSPIVSISSLKEQLLKYSSRDDPHYKIRVLGEFPELLGEFLMGMTLANKCYEGKTALRKKHKAYGYVLAVDVGGGVGRDDSVVTLARMWGNEQYGEEERRVDILDIPLCKNTDSITELYQLIENIMSMYPNIVLALDNNGAGTGLGQKLTEVGIPFFPMNWGSACFSEDDRKIFNNIKAMAYVRLKNAIDRNKFKILNKDQKYKAKIIEQITAIPFVFDKDSRYQILSKQEMKRKGISSPDILDTFAFLYMPSVNYIEAHTGLVSQSSKSAQTIKELQEISDKLFSQVT